MRTCILMFRSLSVEMSRISFIASAMGVLGMVLLTISLRTAGRVLGKRMGALFRG